MPGYHEDDPLFIADPHVVGKLGRIEQTLIRIAESLEYIAPMARWFFENADLIFKPKEDSNAQT